MVAVNIYGIVKWSYLLNLLFEKALVINQKKMKRLHSNQRLFNYLPTFICEVLFQISKKDSRYNFKFSFKLIFRSFC